MRVGNFSVLIPEGVERDSGHVGLEHGKHYTLRLMNHDHRQCDAEVTIDGKTFDTFRLYGRGSMTLERMPDDHGRLTFYKTDTAEAGQAGEHQIEIPNKGLIQVRFVPEKRPIYKPPIPTSGGIPRSSRMYCATKGGGEPGWADRPINTPGPESFARPMGMCPDLGMAPLEREEKTCGGITGVSGHSDQRFVSVGPIDRDEAAAVTISLRLVTANLGPRPLQPAPRGNPVPAPVQ